MRKEAPVFNSTNSVTGYILKIKYPTAGTLKFNNNGIGHLFEEGDPVMIIPCYPNQNYRDQNVVQWKVMREFLTDDTIYYQELGVLGCAQANVLQAEGILPFPVFNRYKFKLDKWVNGRSEHQNANLYVPDMKNTIAFNRNNRDVVNTVLKSIYNLSYNYDYSFNAERIQFKSFKDLVNIWIDGMFKTQMLASEIRQGIVDSSKVVIFSNQSHAFEKMEANFKNQNSSIPIRAGVPYLEIFPALFAGSKFKSYLPQYIELVPRVLQDIKSENNLIINDWYITPLREFVSIIEEYHSILISELSKIGFSEQDLKNVAGANSFRCRNVIIEESETEFKHGNSVYNQLMYFFVNLNYKKSAEEFNDKVNLFYETIFSKLSIQQKVLLLLTSRKVYNIAFGVLPFAQIRIGPEIIFDSDGNPIKNNVSDIVYVDFNRDDYYLPDKLIRDENGLQIEVISFKKMKPSPGSAQYALDNLGRSNRNLRITNINGQDIYINLNIYESIKTAKRSFNLFGPPKLLPLGNIVVIIPESEEFAELFVEALKCFYETELSFKINFFDSQNRFRELLYERYKIYHFLDFIAKISASQKNNFENLHEWTLFKEIAHDVYIYNKQVGHNASSIERDILGNFIGENNSHRFGFYEFQNLSGKHRKPIGLRINVPISLSDTDTRFATFGREGDINHTYLPKKLSREQRFKNFFTSAFISVSKSELWIVKPRVSNFQTEDLDDNSFAENTSAFEISESTPPPSVSSRITNVIDTDIIIPAPNICDILDEEDDESS